MVRRKFDLVSRTFSFRRGGTDRGSLTLWKKRNIFAGCPFQLQVPRRLRVQFGVREDLIADESEPTRRRTPPDILASYGDTGHLLQTRSGNSHTRSFPFTQIGRCPGILGLAVFFLLSPPRSSAALVAADCGST